MGVHNDRNQWYLIGRFAPDSENRCYLPSTLFQVSHHEYKEACGLKVGDKVLSLSGCLLEVASAENIKRPNCKLVTIKTEQAELTVTASHRVIVPTHDNMYDEKLAEQICVG